MNDTGSVSDISERMKTTVLLIQYQEKITQLESSVANYQQKYERLRVIVENHVEASKELLSILK